MTINIGVDPAIHSSTIPVAEQTPSNALFRAWAECTECRTDRHVYFIEEQLFAEDPQIDIGAWSSMRPDPAHKLRGKSEAARRLSLVCPHVEEFQAIRKLALISEEAARNPVDAGPLIRIIDIAAKPVAADEDPK